MDLMMNSVTEFDLNRLILTEFLANKYKKGLKLSKFWLRAVKYYWFWSNSVTEFIIKSILAKIQKNCCKRKFKRFLNEHSNDFWTNTQTIFKRTLKRFFNENETKTKRKRNDNETKTKRKRNENETKTKR